MSYRLIRSTRERFGKRIAAPLGLLALAALCQLLFPNVLSGVAAWVARPLWQGEGFALAAFDSTAHFFSSKEALVRDAETLKAQLAAKDAALLDRDALAEENTFLKQTFGRAAAEPKGILAAVLATPPHSAYDTLVLDAGRSEGASEGALVFIGPLLIGNIIRVTAHTSVAELYSTAGRKTPMRLLAAGVSLPIEAEGRGGGAFTFSLPKEILVSAGDEISMQGLTPILFGKVDSVDSVPTSSFQTVYFSMPVPILSLRFVQVRIQTQ